MQTMGVFSFRLNDILCLTESLFWYTTYFYIKLKLVSKCQFIWELKKQKCHSFLIFGADDASTTSSINFVKIM